MMTLLIFTIGIVLGWVLSSLYSIKHTSNGYFTIEPYDEEETGFYRVNMRIPIEAENYDYFFESELYNNDEYEDEPDAGCQACGGPYPQCKTSCDRFDD